MATRSSVEQCPSARVPFPDGNGVAFAILLNAVLPPRPERLAFVPRPCRMLMMSCWPLLGMVRPLLARPLQSQNGREGVV